MVTTWEHLVSEYSRLNLCEVQELDIIDYLLLRRDAFIDTMSKTEKGVEYLNNAWRLEQTEPDRKALREKFGG